MPAGLENDKNNKLHITTTYQLTRIQLVIQKKFNRKKNNLPEVVSKRLRRSQAIHFEWNNCCFFCGKTCSTIPDPKYPNR